MRYDAVIIGSGLGGLVSAYILAKNGMKVSVFEKNPIPGGCLQTFRRGGVKFETGMHYIGSMGEGESLYRYFKYLDILKDLPLSKLDDNAYDIMSIGGERYAYANGHERFVESLSMHFPGSAEEIEEYVRLCSNVTASSPMYSFGEHRDAPLIKMENLQRSASSFIEDITKDITLRNVLAGISPLYGGVKDITPLYIHALIWDFYNHGTYRIAGGSDQIASSLIASIKAMEGDIFTGAKVLKINSVNYSAQSITVDGLGDIECGAVISDIHPQLLIDLVEPGVFRKVYKDRVRSLKQTTSNFTLYIKFKEGQVPYINSNFYHFSEDVWKCDSGEIDKWPQSYIYMHQCSEVGQKFATHAIVFAPMRWSAVEKWSDTSLGNRGDDYLEFKQMCTERLLNAIEAEFPGTREAIDGVWTSSPLTYRDYTGTAEGSTYGILHDCARLDQTTVSQRTKITNLFLAGQNINSHGVLGVTIGAVLACSELLGFDHIMTQIKEQSK